jgi:hypothetical protein
MIKNHSPLVQALIEALLLLESAGPEEINPDTAVRGMENIASNILDLDESDQLELRAELVRIAEGAEDEVFGEFVRELPNMIGLASP